MAKNLGKAIASGHNPREKIIQPAIVISQDQPPRFPEELAMGEPPIASPFTGDDAIRYLTKLSLIQQVKKREREMEREKEFRKDEDTPEVQSPEISGQSVEDSDSEVGVTTASEDANTEFADPEVEPPGDSADPEVEPHRDSNMIVDSGVSVETADAELHDSLVKESDSNAAGTETSESDSDAVGTETVSELPSENDITTGNDSNVAEPSTSSSLSQALADELQQEETRTEEIPGVDESDNGSQIESEGDGSESDLSEDSSQNPMEHNQQPNPVEQNGDNSNPEEHNGIEKENGNPAEDTESGKESGSNETTIGNKEPPVSTVSSRKDTTLTGAKSSKRGASDEADPMAAVKVANDDLLSRDHLEDYISSVADLIHRNMTPVQRRVPGKIKTREDIRNEEIKKRFPGHRPWPTLDECLKKKVPKSIPFTSTWLAVTAKKIE